MTLSSGCAPMLWSGVAQACQTAVRSGWCGRLSYCPGAGAFRRCRTPTFLAVEMRFYLSGEPGAVNLNSVQGEENALFAHLPLFLALLLLLTGGDRYCAGNLLVCLVSLGPLWKPADFKEQSHAPSCPSHAPSRLTLSSCCDALMPLL